MVTIMNNSFVLLDKPLEDTLKQLHEDTFYGTVEDFCLKSSVYSENHIKELEKYGYITTKDSSTLSGWGCLVTLTYNGINYFKIKKQFIKENRKIKWGEWIRYGITTLISIAALIISIISLLNE